MKKLLLVFAIFFLIASSSVVNAEKRNWEYVKPEIGAQGEGHVFPGVCAPFGLVKLGADCRNKDDNSGWSIDGNIHGFSHLHVSGTGGGAKYGNILLQPIVGDINLTDYSSARSNENFSLGLYEVSLKKYNVDVRLTASDKVGFHEYSFPASTSSKIFVDAGSCLSSYERQELVASGVNVVSSTEIQGYSTVKGGWNIGGPYTVYFYMVTDTPSDDFKTWKGQTFYTDRQVDAQGEEKSGAYLSFSTETKQQIKVKVGISFVSVQKAKENVSELATWDFDEIRNATISKWEQILNTVSVEGSENDKTIFYSAIYHAFLQPSDRTGENPLWNSDEPYFDDYYTIWDTFRATHPLFTLLKPSRQVDMVRSLIDIYEHEGYMPDGRSGNYNGRVQGGSNCDVLIADAITKGLEGIDYEKALSAMIKNAEVEPQDARKEGRGGITDYNTKGYVSTSYERSGTRTFEYAYCDYAIATVAQKLGKQDVYEKYLNRSNNWKNLWNDNVQSLGFKGFLWPKKSNGDWVNSNDYGLFRRDGWEGVIYESFPWEMSFYIPHDMDGLIARCGGKDEFTKRLDTYFTHVQDGFDQNNYIGLFQVENEPGFLVPTLYNYVNRPDKTAEIVRKVLSKKYNTSPTGLPGNDDSGSMSAWYAFHAMGMFPNAGQDIYLISSPLFTKVTLNLENGNIFEILAPDASSDNLYIQSAELNGHPLTRCWLRHSEIVEGGTLKLIMGNEPSNWAFDGEKMPSSPTPIDEISQEIESPKVHIHSYSSQVGEGEAAYSLFADPTKYIKWCDNASTTPWVVFELGDIYLLDRFVFRDSKTVEGNNNVYEYWIYTSNTGVGDDDWEEVVHRSDAGEANVKDDRLSIPKEARWVKFLMKLPKNENAVRIYGFDLYGSLKERTDRGDNISVGKTFVKGSESGSFYSNPRHLFDGLTEDTEYKWKLGKNGEVPYYCIIDLEDEYYIKSFKMYDSNNVSGYNVYVNTVKSDLNQIEEVLDDNTSWQQVVAGEINQTTKEKQVKDVKARYVKLEIPQENIIGNEVAITEFEIYQDGLYTSILKNEKVDLNVFPNPVRKGEPLTITGEDGNISIYSVSGEKIYNAPISDKLSFFTQELASGVYFVKWTKGKREINRKFLVK